MVNFNGSFVSPLSDVSVVAQLAKSSDHLVSLYNGLTIWTALLYLLLAAVVYDQVKYIYQKGSIAGPAMKIPFMGPFLQSMNPDFEIYKGQWRSGVLSCVSVFHKFVVIASDRDVTRKIFNSPAFVKPCVVDAAHKLLGADNWVFLDGKAHVDFRKGLNGLFTRQSLTLYLPGQDETYDKHFKQWLEISASRDNKPIPFMNEFRRFMCAVSCRTFVGHHISDEALNEISDDYYLITAALELVNFPIILPYTRTWYGKKAADKVLAEFAKCAGRSRAHLLAGGEVTCIMDRWILSQIESARYREKVANGLPVDESEKPAMVLRDFADYEIGQTIFTFLFASQDATSSACTWLFQLMADRPEILDKIREENFRLRNGDRNAPLTMDMLENMTYTRAVVKETLRYRPPVIMVPYVAKKNFPVTESYTVPKGSMIIPSVYPATRDPEAYENPDSFNPDRWISGNAEAQTKNWLIFGTGPHYCLGQVYAVHNLMGLVGKASMHMNWEHSPTPLSEKIKVFATIFPQDDCHLVFTPRE